MPVKLARAIEPPLAYFVIARWANGTPSKIVLTQLESDKGTRVGSWKGDDHALDNFRDLARAVGLGTGHFVHLGWVHPHPVGVGRRCSRN